MRVIYVSINFGLRRSVYTNFRDSMFDVTVKYAAFGRRPFYFIYHSCTCLIMTEGAVVQWTVSDIWCYHINPYMFWFLLPSGCIKTKYAVSSCNWKLRIHIEYRVINYLLCKDWGNDVPIATENWKTTSTSKTRRYPRSIFNVNITKQTHIMKQVAIINRCSISSKFSLFIILNVLIVQTQQYVQSSESKGNITLLLKESSLANQHLIIAAIEVR